MRVLGGRVMENGRGGRLRTRRLDNTVRYLHLKAAEKFPFSSIQYLHNVVILRKPDFRHCLKSV